jgi:putative oxidoreductase
LHWKKKKEEAMNGERTMEDIGKLILRLVLGVLILFHGTHKLIYGIEPIRALVVGSGLPAFVTYGVYFGEVVGPLLLLVGWYARVGAALIAVNMLFALGLAHLHQLLSLNEVGGWALELQGMYLFTAIALLLIGPGGISVDRR